jgi:hypothetical protein
MPLTFEPPEYKSARIVARSGSVAVGAVFPALDQPGAKWRWRYWLTGTVVTTHGEARSEQAAKNALLAEWRAFLRAAGLREEE